MNELEYRKKRSDDGTSLYFVYRVSQLLGHITATRGSVVFYPGMDGHGITKEELVGISKKMDDILHGW